MLCTTREPNQAMGSKNCRNRGNDSLPLLGRPTLGELGILKIDQTGGLRTPNKAVRKAKETNNDI